GMKFSADNPSMLDGRDAILLADLVTNGGVYSCLIWDAFAQMGMGVSALTTGFDDLNPLEAFDVPAECSPVLQVNAPTELGAVCLGGFETETLTIFNTGSGDLIVSSVSRTAGSADITVDPLPTTPVFVSADAHIDFTVRCEPTTTGAKTATITIESNDTAQPTLDLVYTCTGGSPNLVTTFASGGSFGDVCLGDDKDLELTLHNSGTCPLTVSSISSGLAEFEVGAVQVLPLVIDGGDTVMVPIQFDPAGDAGAEGTNITIVSNDADSPHLLAVTGNSPPAVVDAFIGDLGVFGNVCVEAVFKELPFTIQNNGACPLDIDGVTLTGGDVADFSLPVLPGTTTLEPANSVVIPVRFNPTSFLPLLTRTTTVRVSSRTLFATTALADDDTVVTGDAPPPDINVPAATATVEFGNVCADENAEKTIDVCNVGGCNLNVTAAAIVDCPDNDFTIVANPFPSIVSPDFCMGVVVRYTPHNEGEHTCRLRISSNDPDEPDVFVNLHGTTPVDIIDVPESVTFLPEVVSSVDVCETKTPFPISNNGLCPLEIQNIFIETNPEEYGLEGVPSFPILLQSGHVAGEGDLRVIFGPDQPLDRDVSGVLRVTYVDDAILGTTADFDAELCGEAVLTGARVLVTNNGTNVDTVDRIQIQRVVGNRNRRPQLDTVAVVQNAPLVCPVLEDPVCADFCYHQEYGTVSNQIQLLPGFYQVTATIRVNNKKYTKTVGFSVNSC
ncbi:MAG TPA: choice-of-anchor D domain-containing protein, partial [Candidatus Limnocylindrales bacterium]